MNTNEKSETIVLFKSTHDVIRAERLCRQFNIPCQAVPVPRSLGSDCGIALEVRESDAARVESILSDNTIKAEFRAAPR